MKLEWVQDANGHQYALSAVHDEGDPFRHDISPDDDTFLVSGSAGLYGGAVIDAPSLAVAQEFAQMVEDGAVAALGMEQPIQHADTLASLAIERAHNDCVFPFRAVMTIVGLEHRVNCKTAKEAAGVLSRQLEDHAHNL